MALIVTKHCKPADRERMLKGHFKVGSHEGYNRASGGGFLDDQHEGTGSTIVPGDITSFTGKIGNVTFVNCRSSGCDIGIGVDHQINTPMFCVSLGPYERRRHEGLLRGVTEDGYQPNAEALAWLSLDGNKLQQALTMATNELFQQKTKWIVKPVVYGDRETRVTAEDFKGFSHSELRSRMMRAAFDKPTRFRVENEMRFIMLPSVESAVPASFLTMTLSEEVQLAFRSTVIDGGGIYAV